MNEFEINESLIYVIEIGDYIFEKDDRFQWIDVYKRNKDYKKYIFEIDTDEVCSVYNTETLKHFCIEWFNKNKRNILKY
jgi:hypothetical protein